MAKEFDVSGVKVMLGMPTNRDLPYQTVRSLVETCSLLQARGIQYDCELIVGSSIVEAARSRVADVFMQSDCTHLFWLDSDMSWKSEDFVRLVAFATFLDVVGGIYPAKKDPLTFFLKVDDETRIETNEFGCMPVRGLGLGFTIVSRKIMQKLSDKSPKLIFPESPTPMSHIFRCDVEDGQFRGEDMAFFSDIRDMGYQIWLDPSVSLGHVGTKEYRGSIKDAMVKE
jgi:hypothetical protein